jgi:hypothetical protein
MKSGQRAPEAEDLVIKDGHFGLAVTQPGLASLEQQKHNQRHSWKSALFLPLCS